MQTAVTLPRPVAVMPCCYGPDVRAATALLACNGHMSIERAADLMGVLLDAPVSAGFTEAWWPGWPPAWPGSRPPSKPGGGTALDGTLLHALRARYNDAVAWGIATNAHRDWLTQRSASRLHLAPRLQTRAAQVWRLRGRLRRPVHQQPRIAPAHGQAPEKIGGCWRSVRTAVRYCLIRSYLGTARNHGIHPLDALAGNPWMPPQTS